MSHNVGGLYVKRKKGVTIAAVAKAITAAWTARGGKVDKRDPKKLAALGLEKTQRLGYAIVDTGDWIVVGESEQYTFDHGVATHVAGALKTDCLWYTLYGATDGGSAQRWGKQAGVVHGYGEVEELLEDLPLAAQHYRELVKLADVEELEGDVALLGFTVDPAKYDSGPDEEDAPPEPAAKAPGKTSSKTKAPFPPVRVKHEKELILRDSFLLAWFLDGSIAKTRKALATALDRFVAFVPPDMLRWSLLGGSSTTVRPVNASTVSRAQGMLKKADAYLWLGSDDAPETGKPQTDEPNCPAYMIHINAGKEPVTMLELRFASDVVWQRGVDAIVAFAVELAKELPLISGYGSLELAGHPMTTGFSSRQRRAALPIALAHPGYAIGNTNSVRDLGTRCLGAHWLTMLGPKLATKAKPALAKTGATLIPAGKNLVVQAGTEPHPDPDPGVLGKVAAALLPYTHLGDRFLASRFEDPETGERDPLAFARWEFRFLGGLAAATAHLEEQDDRASKLQLLDIRIAEGTYARARAAFEIAVEAGCKDRDLGSQLVALSELAEAAKLRDDAVKWLERLQASDTSNHYTLHALGELHERLGNAKEAELYFAKYRKLAGA